MSFLLHRSSFPPPPAIAFFHSIFPPSYNRSSCSPTITSSSQKITPVCTTNPQHPTTPPQSTTSHTTNTNTNANTTSTAPLTTNSPTQIPETALSLLLLNFVTVLWGTQHAVIKLAVQNTSPATLNLSRFCIAALISLPSLPNPSRATLPSYLAGIELSLYLFLGYAFQSVSLLTTSASRSGFLLYLNVKFVPLLARVLYRRRVTPITWGSAALALIGTALLTYDGTPPALGDVWSVLAALASAMFILRLERAAQYPPSAINAISLTSVSVLCAIWSLLTHPPTSPTDFAYFLPTSSMDIIPVLYLGLVTTALSNYLQTLGQRHVPAERAAVIFAMDPVYGTFFAAALLGESLGARGIAGAACIAIAAAVSNADVGTGIGEGFKRVGRWLQHARKELGEPPDRDKD